MRYPVGVALDNNGDVFVADSGNNRIRHLNSDGVIRVFAGSGSAGFSDDSLLRAEFNNPQSIVVTSTGDMFVADTNNHRIRFIARVKGVVITYAGAGISDYRDAEVAVQACISKPLGLAHRTQTNDLFVSDGDSRIRVVRANGAVETILNGAGLAGFSDSSGLSARFNSPSHMTLDTDETTLYIADRRNNRIRAVMLSTLTVYTIAGSEYPPEGGGTLSSDGASSGDVLPGSQLGARFDQPFGIAFYLEPLTVGDVSSRSSYPGRPALLVTELHSHRLRRIIINGNVSGAPDESLASFPYAGSYNSSSGYIDELGPACLFDTPSGVAFMPDSGGSVAFVADAGNHALRRVARKLPSRLQIKMQALSARKSLSVEFGIKFSKRDTVLQNYGYYSINGPPHNETTHAHGILSYDDESHDVTLCAYASSEYYFFFRGSMQVKVSENHITGSAGVPSQTYIAWTGVDAEDERSESIVLRGGGMAAFSKFYPSQQCFVIFSGFRFDIS